MNRTGLWIGELVLLVVATFVFIVLFGHGTKDFAKNAAEEFRLLMAWRQSG